MPYMSYLQGIAIWSGKIVGFLGKQYGWNHAKSGKK